MPSKIFAAVVFVPDYRIALPCCNKHVDVTITIDIRCCDGVCITVFIGRNRLGSKILAAIVPEPDNLIIQYVAEGGDQVQVTIPIHIGGRHRTSIEQAQVSHTLRSIKTTSPIVLVPDNLSRCGGYQIQVTITIDVSGNHRAGTVGRVAY